jgi:GNAT superfamily N-acetyltransferase
VPVSLDDPFMIRPARRDEAEALTALCRRAKAHWGYPAEWLALWAEDLRVTADYAASGDVFVGVTQEGEAVGFFGLRHPARRWHLDHLWIDPAWMRRGFGRRLLSAACVEAWARGARRLHLKSDPHAEEFYLKHGARRVGADVAMLAGQRRELPRLVFDLTG